MMGTGYRHESGALWLFLFAETGHAGLDALLRERPDLRRVIAGNPDEPASHARDRFAVALDMIGDADAELAADPAVRAAFALAAGFAVKIGRETYLGRTFGAPSQSRLYVGVRVAARHAARPSRHRDVPFDEFGKMFAHVAQLVARAAAAATRAKAVADARAVARAAFRNPFKVGDVATDHAPYGARFYRVVKVTRLSVSLTQLLTAPSGEERLPTRLPLSPLVETVRYSFRRAHGTTIVPQLRLRGRAVYFYDGDIVAHPTETGVGE